MTPEQWRGASLGTRTVTWTDRDPILYALAVGARPDELELVYENRLQVLPPFALTLAQWAPDVLGSAGAFDVTTAVQGAQRLEVLAPLPAAGSMTMTARVAEVWDKAAAGRSGAAVFEVEVRSEYFVATWSLFCPGVGGFGGERGPARAEAPTGAPSWQGELVLDENAALLYRLLGDRHPIHVDPAAARAIGAERPILHGLATLGAVVLTAARATGAHPWDVRHVEGRFSAMALPGDPLTVSGWPDGGVRVTGPSGVVIDGGTVLFA